MKKRFSGILMLLCATVIWGSAFVSQNTAMKYMGPFSFQAIRCFLGLIITLFIVYIFDRINKSKTSFIEGWKDPTLWKAGLLCGIPLFFACNLQQFGLVDTDAGKSGFLTAMYIVFVPIIGLFRKRRPNAMIPISILLAVAGLYFLSCAGVTSLALSDLLLLGCAVMFAIQINVVDHYAVSVNPMRLNAVQILVCTILSALAALFTEKLTFAGVITCIPQLAHVGFLSMGLAYGMQILAQQQLEQAPAALIMSLESVFAALFGFLLLNEKMNNAELIGCGLLFAAVILSQLDFSKRK